MRMFRIITITRFHQFPLIKCNLVLNFALWYLLSSVILALRLFTIQNSNILQRISRHALECMRKDTIQHTGNDCEPTVAHGSCLPQSCTRRFLMFLAFSSCPLKWKTRSFFIFLAAMDFGLEWIFLRAFTSDEISYCFISSYSWSDFFSAKNSLWSRILTKSFSMRPNYFTGEPAGRLYFV